MRIPKIGFLFTFLALTSATFAGTADFAPLKEFNHEQSLYARRASSGRINYAVYIDPNLELSEEGKNAYSKQIEEGFAKWFDGVWDLIPQERKNEFKALRPYLTAPKINRVSKTDKILSNPVYNLDGIREFVPRLELLPPSAQSNTQADTIFIITDPDTVIHQCRAITEGCHIKGVIVLPNTISDRLLLHEMGHAFGLADQYYDGLDNADNTLGASSIKLNSLMTGNSNKITCDEADGAVFLLSCKLGLSSIKSWKSICTRNIRIKNCQVEETQEYLAGDYHTLMLPIYTNPQKPEKIISAKAGNNTSIKEGFNPYKDYCLFYRDSDTFTKTAKGQALIRYTEKRGKNYYFVNDAYKRVFFHGKKTAWDEDGTCYNLPEGSSSVFVLDKETESNLYSFTLNQRLPGFIKMETFYGNKDKLLVKADLKEKSVLEVREENGKAFTRKLIFKEEEILMVESGGDYKPLTLTHYEYDTLKPFKVEYRIKDKEGYVREIKAVAGGFAAGNIIKNAKPALTGKFVSDLSKDNDLFFAGLYSYIKEHAIFTKAINQRLKENSFLKQGIDFYTHYIGPLPYKNYKTDLLQSIRRDNEMPKQYFKREIPF